MSAVLAADQAMGDRSRYLGGSDAAAVMGLSPWTTPLELWEQKTKRTEKPQPDPVRQRVLDRGKKLEAVILEMMLDRLREEGHEVELLATNKRYVHPDYPFLACEIDFELMLDGEHINGDCKSVSGFARKKWGEESTEDVPIEYAAQFMHGLAVTGRSKCLVAALRGLDDVAIYWTLRDEETIAAMVPKMVEFWTEHVEKDVPPDPINFSDIKHLFPLDNGQEIEADEPTAQAVEELAGIKRRIKDLKEEEERLTFQIGDYISPNAILTYEGRTICTWKAQMSTHFDAKQFREDQPTLAADYTDSKPVRVLRLSKAKK